MKRNITIWLSVALVIAFSWAWLAWSQRNEDRQVQATTVATEWVRPTMQKDPEAQARARVEATATVPTPLALSLSTPEATAESPIEPPLLSDIPYMLDEINLGVPAGNGYAPLHLAYDAKRRLIYTLNNGRQTNTLSVFDLERGEVVNFIDLENALPHRLYSPNIIDLQLDPNNGRLYALWGTSLEPGSISLTILSIAALNGEKEVAGVDAVAIGSGAVYLANASDLWTLDAASLVETARLSLPPGEAIRKTSLKVGPQQLYLIRETYSGFSIDIFNPETLSSLGAYESDGNFWGLALMPDGVPLVVVESGRQVSGQKLSLEGQNNDVEYYLMNQEGNTPSPVALVGDTLFIQQAETATLQQFQLPDLTALDPLTLPTHFDNFSAGGDGLLYATASRQNQLWQLNPVSGRTTLLGYTGLKLMDVLFDPDTNKLYVLDSSQTLRVLNAETFAEVERVDTSLCSDEPPWIPVRLSLDPVRRRIYKDGDPICVFDADTLVKLGQIDIGIGGQAVPNPSSDMIYVTRQCSCGLTACDTLLINADTFTGTQTIEGCMEQQTTLDSTHQRLYIVYAGASHGSNYSTRLGRYDVSQNSPLPLPLEESGGDPRIGLGALDPVRDRAFIFTSRQSQPDLLQRYDGTAATPSVSLEGASSRAMLYNPQTDRLYVGSESLQAFDGDLNMLAYLSLPEPYQPVAVDVARDRLFYINDNAQLVVLAGRGGMPSRELTTGHATATRAGPPSRLVAAGDDILFGLWVGHLFRSNDEGQSWEPVGAGLPDVWIRDVAIPADAWQAGDQTIFVSPAELGVWQSADGGETWALMSRGLRNLYVGSLFISPTYTQDHTLIASTTSGLFRFGSDSASQRPAGSGQSDLAWVSWAESHAIPLVQVGFSPNFAEDGLVFMSHEEFGLLRSENSGETWQPTLENVVGVIAPAPDLAESGLVLALSSNNTLWRSENGGLSWQDVTVDPNGTGSGGEFDIFYSPEFEGDRTVYALLTKYNAPGALYRSIDAGLTWQKLNPGSDEQSPAVSAEDTGLPKGSDLGNAVLLPNGDLLLVDLTGQMLQRLPNDLVWESTRN